MIRDISIQNFRCFENTSISGFKTVNLITGKNNAGKSALLEALLIGNSPKSETITALRFYRRESQEFSQALPEKTWDNLFFQQDKSKNIFIQINEDNDKFTKLNLFVDVNPVKAITEVSEANNITDKYTDLLPNSDSRPSVIQISVNINNQESFESSLIATGQGIVGKLSNITGLKKTSFIPAFFTITNTQLSIEYDKARLNNQDKEVLKGLQIIDPSIKIIESFNIGSPMLYLQRENEQRLPLSLFGDAVIRIATMILYFVSNNSNILIVDEIENGIHYSNQDNLWRMIFRLAKELDVQFFATTHSLEMLKAFTKVGLESEFSDLAVHFEMARSVKTGQIIGIKRDMETLEYSLNHNKGVRGE